tara:strand:- start:586 stop:816 length:231 start_codon:yes stop_codon:yes gene_type:complete
MSNALLHLVFGGKVTDPQGQDFVDPDNLEIVGIYPNYAKALTAWRGASQAHVDDANMKYVIVHLHRLLEPEEARDH